jgi:hypothetical protein
MEVAFLSATKRNTRDSGVQNWTNLFVKKLAKSSFLGSLQSFPVFLWWANQNGSLQ